MKSLKQQSLVFLLCALYGSVFVFGKITLEYSTPLFVTAARMLLAGLMLLAYQFFFHRNQFTISKAHLWPLFFIAIFGVYLTNAFEFYGLEFMDAGKACFLYSFAPIATALISRFFFSEKLNTIKWAGLIIGILGFLPMLLSAEEPSESRNQHLLFLSFAEIAILIAAVTSSIGWIGMQSAVKRHHSPPLMANGISMLLGGLVALMHSFLIDNWDPIPVAKDQLTQFLPWFLVLMIVSNLISYNLNAVLLRTFSATYMALAGLTQPLFAALFGWLFLNEVMSPYFWVSVVIVSLGLFIYYRGERLQQDLFHKK